MPCDMSKYPADWQERRARILARAGHCCEECGVGNGAIGRRFADGVFVPLETLVRTGVLSLPEGDIYAKHLRGLGLIKIVLTVAHLIEDGPLDCPDSDLRALCQKCHNARDAKMRARHRREKTKGGAQCALEVL